VKVSVDDIFGILSAVDEKSHLHSLPLFCAANSKRVPVVPDDRSDFAAVRYDVSQIKERTDY